MQNKPIIIPNALDAIYTLGGSGVVVATCDDKVSLMVMTTRGRWGIKRRSDQHNKQFIMVNIFCHAAFFSLSTVILYICYFMGPSWRLQLLQLLFILL